MRWSAGSGTARGRVEPGRREAAERAIFLDECRHHPWSPEIVECFAKAVDLQGAAFCESRFSESESDALQARLDAIPASPTKVTQDLVDRIANDYYPQWAIEPQHTGCPPPLDELAELTADPAHAEWRDAWGSKLVMTCDAKHRLLVTSPGRDRRLGTADDIRSDHH